MTKIKFPRLQRPLSRLLVTGFCLLLTGYCSLVVGQDGPKRAFYWRARVKESLGRERDALQDYDRAIELDPNDPTAYSARAILREKRGDAAGAKADATKAVALNPFLKSSEEITAGNRGRELNLTERMGKLLELPEKELKAEQYVERGMAKYAAKDGPGAVRDFTCAIAIKPACGEAFYFRGRVKSASLNDEKGALADLDKAAELLPNHADTYYVRGMVKNFLGDRPGALKELDHCIKLAPDHAYAYAARGYVKVALADYAGAVAGWEKAIRLDPIMEDILQPAIGKARAQLR